MWVGERLEIEEEKVKVRECMGKAKGRRRGEDYRKEREKKVLVGVESIEHRLG